MTAMLDDPKKMSAFLSALTPNSVSNAGRNEQLTNSKGRGGAELSSLSFTAALTAKSLEQQKKMQDAFTQPSKAANHISDKVINIIDSQMAAIVEHQFGGDSLSPEKPVLIRSTSTKAPTALNVSTLEGTADGPASPNPASSSSAMLSPTRPSPRQDGTPHRPNASFLTPERFKEINHNGNVPPVGHYRPKHSLTEGVARGGYIEPKPHHHHHSPRAAPQSPPAASDEAPASPTLKSNPSSSRTPQHGASDVSATVLKDSPRQRAKEKAAAQQPPPPMEDIVFKSKAPKMYEPYPTDGADAWYWPRCDRRLAPAASTSVDFSKHTPRKPFVVPSENPDAYYNVAKPFGSETQHVTMDISARTSRDKYPVEKKSLYQDADLPYDPHVQLKKLGPAAQVHEFSKDTPRKPFAEPAVSVSVEERDDCLGDVGSQVKRTRGPIAFEKQTVHPPVEARYVPVVYDTIDALTSPRHRSALVDPKGPGHLPLHVPSITEFSAPPSLNSVRPSQIQDVNFDKCSKRAEMKVPLHDLSYDTQRDPPNLKKLACDPKIALNLSREKREKATSFKPQGTQAVYTYGIDSPGSGAHLDFSKQVTRENQFASRLAPSGHWEANNPRSPGPGAYNVHM